MSTPDNDWDADSIDDSGVEEVGSINIGPGTIDPRSYARPVFANEAEFHVAVLLLESSSDDPDYRPLYEESFVLVKAESEEEAREKAADYAKSQHVSFHNEYHQLITWKLKRVVEVKPVEDATFDDGTELFSRMFRDHAAYTAFSSVDDEE